MMKSTLKISTFDSRLGEPLETRQYTFHNKASGINDPLDVIAETLKAFSYNRASRKIILSLTIEKEGK